MYSAKSLTEHVSNLWLTRAIFLNTCSSTFPENVTPRERCSNSYRLWWLHLAVIYRTKQECTGMFVMQHNEVCQNWYILMLYFMIVSMYVKIIKDTRQCAAQMSVFDTSWRHLFTFLTLQCICVFALCCSDMTVDLISFEQSCRDFKNESCCCESSDLHYPLKGLWCATFSDAKSNSKIVWPTFKQRILDASLNVYCGHVV